MRTKLIDLNSYPVETALSTLLKDKTTKQNIIFATDMYSMYGIDAKSAVTEEALKLIALQPRVEKTIEEKAHRTKTKAEVFTPSWIVNKMNNCCDTDWFGFDSIFNVESSDHSWVTIKEPVAFMGGKKWQDYVQLLRLEITCGEAPFVVSRYDSATGKLIPINDRIGFLDRKLRIVSENAKNEEEWTEWSTKALQSSYGYEFQGDNLIIARINVLVTMCEYRDNLFGGKTSPKQILKWANIISWNFWQMDGFTGEVPFKRKKEPIQLGLFDQESNVADLVDDGIDGECKIRNWRQGKTFKYNSMKAGI